MLGQQCQGLVLVPELHLHHTAIDFDCSNCPAGMGRYQMSRPESGLLAAEIPYVIDVDRGDDSQLFEDPPAIHGDGFCMLLLAMLYRFFNINIFQQSLALGTSRGCTISGPDRRLGCIKVDQIFLDETLLSWAEGHVPHDTSGTESQIYDTFPDTFRGKVRHL